MNEKEVFIQKVSDVEMESVASGLKDDSFNCSILYYRDINAGGFPNCAATVERESWCGANDACVETSVVYTNMTYCDKAWN